MCTSFKNKDMKSCGHLVTLYYLEMVAKEKGLKG